MFITSYLFIIIIYYYLLQLLSVTIGQNGLMDKRFRPIARK